MQHQYPLAKLHIREISAVVIIEGGVRIVEAGCERSQFAQYRLSELVSL
jgi:hypothetical protein